MLKTEQIDVMRVSDAFVGYFSGKRYAAQAETLSVCCAYVLYKAQQTDGASLPEIETVLDTMKGNSNVYSFIEPRVKEHWECVKSNYKRFSSEALAAFILNSPAVGRYNGGFIEATPASIVNLSFKLLDIDTGERVADFGTGTGTFLLYAFSKINAAVNYYGVEIEPSMAAILSIKAELLCDSITYASMIVEYNDMFIFAKEKGPFDKIFSNYPFGTRLKNLRGGLDYVQKSAYLDFSKATSSDWVFNYLLVSSITDRGKAVGIMTNGSTWNSIDSPIRGFFVQEGLIETIIALPEKMFSMTPIPTTLVVFSLDNRSVRMIDAHDIYQKGRRQNEFSEDDIAKITSALTKDSEISRNVSLEEIVENEFVINPTRYLKKLSKIQDGKEFGRVIISITRGAHLTAGQLDEMTSQTPTNVQFLKLSNIQDGYIDEELPYLKEKEIDMRNRRYLLRTGDLLISKNGLPFKIAVADVKPNTSIIANTNIYIIRLDEKIVNPHYLKAYFESEHGMAALNRISTGTTLLTIGTEQLQKLIIPVPPLEIQHEFVERYLVKAEEVKRLKYELEKTQAELKKMFETIKAL